MSGGELEPLFAAQLAANIYAIKEVNQRRLFIANNKDNFNLEENSLTTGQTGGYLVNRKHLMALMCTGKGKYQGQAFVAIKGTASLYDLVTDLNAGLRNSHTGFPVHQGFYHAFDSILTDMKMFASKFQGVSVVHCVGHSLGGAIATLAADWFRVRTGVPVKLYTFGSPRVGLESFASKCTTNLNPENIYRVYHSTDPVPTLPTWPFSHVPNTSVGYCIKKSVPAIPWEYHRMKHYITSMEKKGWKALPKTLPTSYFDATIEKWLKSDGFLSFTANTLEMFNAAILYVMKKALNLLGIAIVGGAAGTLTFLDRLAMMLSKVDTKITSYSLVYDLIRRMASAIGFRVQEGTELTFDFIRMIFMRLYQRVAEMVKRIGMEIG